MSTDNPSEKDLITLFLACSVNASLGGDDALDRLIEDYAPKLPPFLQLGLRHISEDYGNNSQTIRRYIKRLSKQIQSGQKISLLKQIYEQPINHDQE